MGDRANFGFKQSNGHVLYLYGHWAGYDMLPNLAAALEAARPRWNDEAYATRIAISQLVGEQWPNETGWGLYIDTIGDNEYAVPVVDWAAKTVSMYAASWDQPFTRHSRNMVWRHGFSQFIAQYKPAEVTA